MESVGAGEEMREERMKLQNSAGGRRPVRQESPDFGAVQKPCSSKPA
jgi:hypothetical protein